MTDIETAHLRLTPYAPEHLLTLIEEPDRFAERVGVPAAAGLREFMVSNDVSPDWIAKLRTSGAPDPWVHGFAVIHRDSSSVIGSAAFKGPPDAQGVVEIAYGIVPTYEGKGYATEAADALVTFAMGSGRVSNVRAHTLREKNASCRVLEKAGFAFMGEVVDPEDGEVWRWERRPSGE